MNILRFGDPHAKVGNLDEMKPLVLFVGETAIANKVDRIEIMGDLLHTHAVIRLEVLMFWEWALTHLANICEVVVLVGNHDISGDYSSNVSALTLFGLIKDTKFPIRIVDRPIQLGVFGYVSYTHSPDDFIRHAMVLADSGTKVLVCHQTIDGSKYESGMYAPDGIPTGEWAKRFTHVFSGHIHSEQEFGNITYPGTARWDSTADANLRKGIWIYDHEDGSGALRSGNFVGTEKVCSPIKSIVWNEGDPEIESWPENARVAVELVGSSVWVAQQKLLLKGKCSIKTKITDKKTGTVRTAGKNFEHFVQNFFSTKFDREALIKYGKELGVV